MSQFQQHYVAGEHLFWPIEFLVDDDLTDRNANGVLVRLWSTMLTNDRNRFIEAKRSLKSVHQKYDVHFTMNLISFDVYYV